MIEGRYLVTNAHVVWPFAEADLAFPDGSTHTSVPVVGWDLVADLAVLGPVDTDIAPAVFAKGMVASIGSEVFLIGYSAGQETAPELGRGIVTRIRDWQAAEVTYYQTDVPVRAGQSGGVLVSDSGEVLGLVGHVVEQDDFALASSAEDVSTRANSLIADGGPVGIAAGRIPLSGGALEHRVELGKAPHEAVFVFNEAAGTEIEITVRPVESDSYARSSMLDVNGQRVLGLPCVTQGTLSGTIETAGPHFLTIAGSGCPGTPGPAQIVSNRELIPYEDPDDGRAISAGDTLWARLDHSSDTDRFVIDLIQDEVVDLSIESLSFTP